MRCSGNKAHAFREGCTHSNMVCSCGWVQMEDPMMGEQASPMIMGVTVPFSQVGTPSGESSPFSFLQPAIQQAIMG